MGYSIPASGGGTSDPFTTNETLTNRTWIDGKPIYRKVVDIGVLPIGGSKFVLHGVVGATLYTNVSGIANTGVLTIPVPFATGSATTAVSLWIDGANIVISTGNDRSAYTGKVILEYTK